MLYAMENLLSTSTLQFLKEKLKETLELVISVSRRHKIVLIGTGAVIGVYWYMTRNHGYFQKLGIPGPKPGLFGAFSNYQKEGIIEFDRQVMKKYGKVVGIYHAAQPIYMISDADMIRQISVKEFSTFVNRDNNTFPMDPLFKDSVVTAHGEHWKFIRSILSPAFTSGRMRQMAPLLQKCVESLVRNLWTLSEQGTKSVKMREVLSMYTMDVITSIAFGVEVDCQADPGNPFLKNAKKMTGTGPRTWIIYFICSLIPRMKNVFEAMGTRIIEREVGDFFLKTITGAIAERTENDIARNDFLQLLLNSHKLEEDREDDDPDTHLEFDKTKTRGLTNDEIVSNSCLFLLTGFDTISTALTFVAYNLATNPECQEKLIEEVDHVLKGNAPDYETLTQLHYLENVFLETLRIFPSGFRTSRIASEDININGYLIKKGMEVHFPVTAIHNDPDYWQNPEKFDPDRFLPENRPENYNYVYLAFGAGPRHCIGMRLAQVEAKTAIAGILQKYRFKPAPETKIPPELKKNEMGPTDDMVLMIEKR